MSTFDPASLPRPRDVRRRFDRAAARFDDADFVHGVTRDGLLARLAPMTLNARTIVDLGAATGKATKPLRQRFRGARVVSVDLSARMLERSRRGGLLGVRRHFAVQADARALPFADGSIDLVFSNLLLPWVGEPGAVFAEVGRVLRKDGLFVFATFGPDSLLKLRRAWQAASDRAHVNHFFDMHDVGDAIVRAGLGDPVLDVDRLTVTYKDAGSLFADLTASGARNCLAGRPPGLTGKQRFARMREQLLGSGSLAVDLELVYGHCFGTGRRPADGSFAIDAGSIPRRRR